MAENTNRSVFGLNGVTGMLIATVLLLTILVGLTVWGLQVQQGSATKAYSAKDYGKLTQDNKEINEKLAIERNSI